MYAAQVRSGVPSEYPSDRASQVSRIGGTVKLVSTGNTTGRVSIAAEDIAQVIAFALSRPRSVSLNEILVRPTAQEL
jgi:NADP-dependent 3-hydroxy acid dehydrogenase YdfG